MRIMRSQLKKKSTLKKQRIENLPADFNEFVKWVNSLPISRGTKRTIIVGVQKAFSMGLYSLEDVKMLPRTTKGFKSMKYGMSKYEEFLSEKDVFD